MRGKIGEQTRLKHIWYRTPLYNRRIMKNFISSLEFLYSKQALFRLKAIKFSRKYGIRATIDALSVSRTSIFRWKNILKDSKGILECST